MQTPTLYQEIADAMQQPLSGDLIMCIEAACITQMEWEADPGEVKQRVGGAIEELTDYDSL